MTQSYTLRNIFNNKSQIKNVESKCLRTETNFQRTNISWFNYRVQYDRGLKFNNKLFILENSAGSEVWLKSDNTVIIYGFGRLKLGLSIYKHFIVVRRFISLEIFVLIRINLVLILKCKLCFEWNDFCFQEKCICK